MHACSQVTLAHPQKHGGVFYPHTHLAYNITSTHPPHSLRPSIPHLSDLAHKPAPHPPLPPSLLTSSPPNTPARSEPTLGEVVVWFENLVASIRIKIRIYKNSPMIPVSFLLHPHCRGWGEMDMCCLSSLLHVRSSEGSKTRLAFVLSCLVLSCLALPCLSAVPPNPYLT
jgi:hypothetical protein